MSDVGWLCNSCATFSVFVFVIINYCNTTLVAVKCDRLGNLTPVFFRAFFF